ncbi:MAG: glycosyltransferase [Planctomycetes bacterium]|nr:glycosyltransferase [Planctomycetota bacterium]
MNIAVLTSLYPSSVRPREGIFAERRWSGMLARGHQVRVVHPLPWAPFHMGRADWKELAQMAERETRVGIGIERPRYLHVPKMPRRNARAFARRGMTALLAHGRPDVVVADYAWPAAAAAPLCARQRLPLVVSGRGSDVLQVAGEAGLGSQLSAYLRESGHWCAVSQHLVDALDELAGERGRGVLVPNGVDTQQFHPRDRAAMRAELGLDARAPLVLVVGHLIERKDPLLALAAFAALEARLDARLVFIGRGELATALDRDIARRGLAQRVRRVGELDPSELARWYGAADALLLTSRREGRPNVVLEALACGLPVLACDAGGTSELLQGFDAMLVRSREPTELARRLAAVLEQPPPREALLQRAQTLGWERGLEVLERLLDDARRARSTST